MAIEDLSPLQMEIVNLLSKWGEMSRGQLVIMIKAKRTTVYDNLASLVKKGLVERHQYGDGDKGRPFTYWRLKNDE